MILEREHAGATEHRFTRRDLRLSLWFLASAWIVRLLPVFLRNTPLFSDEIQYEQMARDILATGSHAAHIFYPCGYGYFAAAVSALAGPAASAVMILQSFLASFIIPLLYLLGRRCGLRQGPSAAGAASYLILVQPALHGGLYMSDTFFTTVTFLALLALVWSGRPGRPALGLAGFLLGWAWTTREIGFAGLALAALLVLSEAQPWRRRLSRTALLLLAAALPLGYVIIANWRAHGVPALETNTGLNLWLGNNPQRGILSPPGGSEQSFPYLPGETELEYGRRATRIALQTILANPPAFLLRWLLRFGQILGPNPGRELLYAFRDRIPPRWIVGLHIVGSFIFWIGLLPSLFLPLRRPRPMLAFGAYFFLYNSVAAVAVFVPRYRLPALPFAALLFAGGTAAWLEVWRRRKKKDPSRRVRVGLALLLAALLAGNMCFFTWRDHARMNQPAYWRTWEPVPSVTPPPGS